MRDKHITLENGIWYVGTNDRKKTIFENNWPLPYGVSYNSYLITDEKSALIDTIEYGSDNSYLCRIGALLEGKSLDYLVVNHMEPDHSSMLQEVLRVYPNVKVVGNAQTFKMLKNYFNLPTENFHEVKDGDAIELGERTLRFYLVTWVHWPETMVTFEESSKTLFSCDAFGGFGALDGGIFDYQNNFEEIYLPEMRRYFSNIVAKYCLPVQKAIAKLGGLEIRTIAPSHGLIWKENPGKVVKLYDSWSRYEAESGVVIAYASMYGNVEKVADGIGRAFADSGLRVRVIDVTKTEMSYILSDIWRYKGLILGSCAYNGKMHPMMAHLCNEINLIAPKNKVFGIFGGSTWNGAGVKDLKKFAEENKFEIVEPVVEINGSPFFEDTDTKVAELVKAVTEKIKG